MDLGSLQGAGSRQTVNLRGLKTDKGHVLVNMTNTFEHSAIAARDVWSEKETNRHRAKMVVECQIISPQRR
ncbi:hypothetical protein [Xanthovirga aplysinae]|uniref:hypothetical protein n=1 Tax=Xanthovirga aplysinae TaxID=2529853 RepID=UPI0012BB8D0B|nr:hypothetical protein [Xanthovirga aplysinae]MTI29798.1 hypothetical protein [Xanthovirga aplysinae]